MKNNRNIRIGAGIIAITAPILFGVSALAGNMNFELNSPPGVGTPSELQKDNDTVPGARSARTAASVAAILGTAPSGQYQFFSPGPDGIETAAIGSESFDIRDAAHLGKIGGRVDLDPLEMLGPVSSGTMTFAHIGLSQVVVSQDLVPNLSQTDQDRPTVINWIYSLLEAVGINERCSDPNGCDSRVAVNE